MPRDYRPWTEDSERQLRQLVAERKTSPVIAKILGRGLASINNKITALGLVRPPRPDDDQAAAEWTRRNSILPVEERTSPEDPVFASPYAAAPYSVEQIVEMFRIDLDVWEPYYVRPNIWQMGAKHPDTGEILTENLYATRVTFRRRPDATARDLVDGLLADVRADTKARARVRIKPPAGEADSDPHMLEADLFDAHLNKLSWAVESGENYDTDIAEQRVRAAVTDLLAGAAPYNIERITLPIGNDFTNIDGLLKQTTAGTPQDTDTRYHRMFRQARGLGSWMIETCAQIAPVEVVIVPGNHDELTAWTLGQVLEAEYGGDSRVTFQSGPKLRKYVEYGANLIGFTHGCDEPHRNLPQIMAVEQPDAWGRTTYREWHVGHLHKQKATQPVMVDDNIGVTVRIIRALTATDAWHFRKGYVGGTQGAEAFVWKKSGGLRAHLYHTVRDV